MVQPRAVETKRGALLQEINASFSEVFKFISTRDSMDSFICLGSRSLEAIYTVA